MYERWTEIETQERIRELHREMANIRQVREATNPHRRNLRWLSGLHWPKLANLKIFMSKGEKHEYTNTTALAVD